MGNPAHPTPPVVAPPTDTRQGFLLALSAYVLWGALPLYFTAVAHVPTAEVIAHRIVWSVPIALAVLWALGRTADLGRALRSPRMLGGAALTATLLSANWGVYVWAIQTGQTLEAALGYFINPLFSILLAALVLKERLHPRQWAAVALASAAVALLTWEAGRLPLVAMGLFLTWGIYALCKRALPIGPNQGFALEVIVLTPLALGWLVWLAAEGRLTALTDGPQTALLLLGAGAVTAVPLMLYANGAKGLRLSTIALMQYLTPSLLFLVAIFALDERIDGARLVAFPMIWAALILYSSAYRAAR